MSNRTVVRTAALTLAAALAALPGCKTDEATSEDVAAASQSIESSAEVTYMSAYFAGAASAEVRSTPTADAAASVLGAVRARIMADLADSACATVDTDGTSYVAVTFLGCTGAHGLLGLSGTVRADLAFETAACGPFQCPVAITYTVSTDDLQVGRTAVSGSWEVRDPLAADQPYTWTGMTELTSPRRHVSSQSMATFTRQDDCVDVSLEGSVTGSAGRTLTVSTHDVHRCMGSCPTAGTVVVTGQAGATWSWTYDGEGGATVTGAGGNTFDVELACAE